MILEKHFQFHPDVGLKCINKDDVARYIEDKIIEYRKFENFNSRNGRYSLLNEILNMYEEDIQNVYIDTTPIHHIKYYDKFNTNTVLQYYDLIWILGSIIYNVFDYEDNKLVHIENGIRGPILMGDMFAKGYKELNEIKNNNINVAYSPILIFVTLLESELKSKFKDSFIQKTISKIEEKANQGTIVISDDENDLIHYLKHDQYSEAFNGVYATTVAAYNLFLQYDVIDSNDSGIKNLILNNITLNQLTQLQQFTDSVDPAFSNAMKLLFKTSNLNLRNDIAHGGFGYKNYYHPSVAGILYYMLMLVFDDHYLKE